MTTAFDFPDLSISPIRFEQSSVHNNMPPSQSDIIPDGDQTEMDVSLDDSLFNTIGMTHRLEGTSRNDLSDSLESTQSPNHNSSMQSSEEAFQEMANRMEHLFPPDSFVRIGATPSQTNLNLLLTGIRAFVHMGCCTEKASSIRRKLREMGAVVSRRITSTTSHVIFSHGGSRDRQVLQKIYAMERKPFLLDPHWVDECYVSAKKKYEIDYSLYGGRYFIDSIRRTSSIVNPASARGNASSGDLVELTPPDNENEIVKDSNERRDSSSSAMGPTDESIELTFEQSMTATQLLTKINTLSRRLRRLKDDEDEHGGRCQSRTKRHEAEATALPENVNFRNVAVNTIKITVDESKQVLRRRTHAAFALSHRAPHSIAVKVAKYNHDVRETVEETPLRDIGNRLRNENVQHDREIAASGVDNMKKTTQTDLNLIRKTLQNNARVVRERTAPKNRTKVGGTNQCEKRRIEETEDTISQEMMVIRTPTLVGRAPIVKTSSALMNRLQCIPSSDEFKSTKKKSRVKKPLSDRKGIIFTGLSKRDVTEWRRCLSHLPLSIQSIVDDSTRCVISYQGDRTLSVLKAVVLGIPVVTTEWLDACLEKNKLISTRDYEYPSWRQTIKNRGTNCRLFYNMKGIFIADGCTPSSSHLKWMVRKSGGKVLTELERDCDLIVAPGPVQFRVAPGEVYIPPPVVNEKYILDCITRNEILMCSEYMEEDIDQQIA